MQSNSSSLENALVGVQSVGNSKQENSLNKSWRKYLFGTVVLVFVSGISILGGYQLGVKQSEGLQQFPDAQEEIADSQFLPTFVETVADMNSLGQEPESFRNNWLMYTSRSGNFSFSYPPDFKVEEAGTVVKISKPTGSDSTCTSGGCLLGTSNLSIEFATQENTPLAKSLGDVANQSRNLAMQIDNNAGEVLETDRFSIPFLYYESTVARYTHNYFGLLKNNKILHISFLFTSETENESERMIAETVLSSLEVF